MLKKITIFFIILIIGAVCLFVIFNTKNKPSEQEKLNIKLDEEIKYLSKNIIELSNEFNNIVMNDQNTTKETTDTIEKNENDKSNDSNEQSDKSSKEKSEDSKSSSTITNYNLNIEEKNIGDTDWKQIESDLSSIESTWSQIIVDLYKTKIDNDNILKFSTTLDELSKNISNQDKLSSIIITSNLYDYIPVFYNSYKQDNDRTIILENAKVNLVKSYSLIESEKWDEISKFIQEAEQNYLKILNDVNNNKNQYNFNKAYIVLKEYQNSINTNDKKTIYYRYKKLIEEMVNLA